MHTDTWGGYSVRRASKRDLVEREIIDGLARYGVHAWQLDFPCDLACWHSRWGPGNFKLLEVKTPHGKRKPKARLDKRQEAQNEFIALTGTPIVTDLSTALAALGLIPSTSPSCACIRHGVITGSGVAR